MSFVPTLAQTFEMALAHHRHGRWTEALSVYRAIETRQSHSPELTHLIIDVLRHQGAFEDIHFEEQKLSSPADLSLNLTVGHAFLSVQSYDAAVRAFQIALHQDPNHPEALTGLARAHRHLGDVHSAQVALNTVLDQDHHNDIARIELAQTYFQDEQYERVLSLITPVLSQDPHHLIAVDLLSKVLPRLSFRSHTPDLEHAIVALLQRPDIDGARAASTCIMQLLAQEAPCAKAIQWCLNGDWAAFYTAFVDGALPQLAQRPIFLALLNAAPLSNAQAIALFLGFRRSLLKHLLKYGDFEPHMIPLVSAISRQSMLNGFVRPYQGAEREAVNRLQDQLATKLLARTSSPAQVMPALGVLSAYFPILTVPNFFQHYQSWTAPGDLTERLDPHWVDILIAQVQHPLEEQRLTRTIQKVSSPSDAVTKKVCGLYNDYPGPRWQSAPRLPYETCGDWMQALFPSMSISDLFDLPTDVLVAGCGTGRIATSLASSVNVKRIDAVDLSVWSLAYAERQSKTILNQDQQARLRFSLGDIHDLRGLNCAYDLILSEETVSETATPVRAVRSLLDVLRPHGVLQMALPSKSGSHALMALKKYVTPLALKGTAKDAQILQREVWRSDAPQDIIGMRQEEDFHNTNQCIQKCFPVQRHAFSIDDVIDLLEINSLKLLGIECPDAVSNRPASSLPAPDDIYGWKDLEQRLPSLFHHGYRIWTYRG